MRIAFLRCDWIRMLCTILIDQNLDSHLLKLLLTDSVTDFDLIALISNKYYCRRVTIYKAVYEHLNYNLSGYSIHLILRPGGLSRL